MKLLFSEYKSDYTNYIFPYAIWAIPEPHETPAMIFTKGFLPSSPEFERFYLCRQVRIDLNCFELSSENRRIVRKSENMEFRLIPRSQFEYTKKWRKFCKTYADIKFGKDVMTYERLDSLFNSKIVSHLLVFTDTKTKKDVGIVTLYLEKKSLAYYYYSFYNLNYYVHNLGMFLMTSAVDYFSGSDFSHIYLGTCYSRNSLYKTQFKGAEFFNGFQWSNNLKELKYLIERDKGAVNKHLIETKTYQLEFYEDDLGKIIDTNGFSVILEPPR